MYRKRFYMYQYESFLYMYFKITWGFTYPEISVQKFFTFYLIKIKFIKTHNLEKELYFN